MQTYKLLVNEDIYIGLNSLSKIPNAILYHKKLGIYFYLDDQKILHLKDKTADIKLFSIKDLFVKDWGVYVKPKPEDILKLDDKGASYD